MQWARVLMQRLAASVVHGSIELAGAERVDRILAGKQPAAIEHLALGAGDPPPGAQALEQHLRRTARLSSMEVGAL